MTEQEILDRLALYKAAEAKIVDGNQSYTIAGVTYTRADLAQVRAEIAKLRNELIIAQNGGSLGCRPVVFGGR